MTEAEEAAAKAVSLAREVIDKYGADADKPSVKLAIALINGAHERDALRAEAESLATAAHRSRCDLLDAQTKIDQLQKLLPECLGEWTGGSGGHRKYAGGCNAHGVWDVGIGFVCDQHRNTKGGDDDAWSWAREREILIGLASPNIDGMDIAAERLMLMTARLAKATEDLDYAKTHPFEALRAMGFEVDETGIKRQQIMERELVKVTAERDEALMQIKEMQEHS